MGHWYWQTIPHATPAKLSRNGKPVPDFYGPQIYLSSIPELEFKQFICWCCAKPLLPSKEKREAT